MNLTWCLTQYSKCILSLHSTFLFFLSQVLRKCSENTVYAMGLSITHLDETWDCWGLTEFIQWWDIEGNRPNGILVRPSRSPWENSMYPDAEKHTLQVIFTVEVRKRNWNRKRIDIRFKKLSFSTKHGRMTTCIVTSHLFPTHKVKWIK